MSEYFLGEIRPFGGNFAPLSWALCNGALLPIAQNNALYSLIGTTFGGDGQTTFALPDLRGRLPISMGQGPGLQNYPIGQMLGTETVTLTLNQMAQHNHSFNASNSGATATSPTNAMPAVPANGGSLYLTPSPTSTDVPLPPQTLTAAGGNQAHNNIMPSMAVTYIIAIEGIYPSRN